ncbi:hypothetical protein, partial [Pseudomonas aeruginosa]|uniref:hypothetical protein n=1 Tax=Pseudomonas aeruginosa TaxID=287 RepID=UPI001EF517A7
MLGPTLQARAALEPICEPRPADRRLLRGGAAGFRLADQRDQALLALAVVAEGIRRFFQGQQH